MKKVSVVFMLLVAMASFAGVASAQSPDVARRGAVRGEVTTVSESSLTVSTLQNQTITVNITGETRIRLAETRSEGSLSDIAIGNFVGVQGRKNADDSLNARAIVVLPQNPQNLDRVRGKVTAIDNNVIVLDTPTGETRITTNENTRIRIGQQPGSLADINIDDPVLAAGDKLSESQFNARLVAVVTAEQVRQHTLRGEVLAVEAGAGQITVEGRGEAGQTWTVQTTDNTKYRIPNVDNPALANIAAGDHVLVVGRKNPAEVNTGTAWVIAVIPEDLRDSQFFPGEVTAVSGSTFTLSGVRGEVTVLTTETTRYRTRGTAEVSFEDLEPGLKVAVAGHSLSSQPNTIQAQVIAIREAGTP